VPIAPPWQAVPRHLWQRVTQNNLNWVFALSAMILFLGPAARAEERCSVEVKLLLSPQTAQTVIASLGFKDEAAGRVYFFDTTALELLMQGVIVRVRQGANNDLTIKVRLPKGDPKVDSLRLHERFPCEIDRNQIGESTSYAIKRRYDATKVPENGGEIYRLLSVSQKDLLHEARISLDWDRVVRIADINSTKWETTAQSPSGQLALELWEWPAGKVLELSAKVESDAEASKYAELEHLVHVKNLSLDPSQDTKTSVVLKAFAGHASPPK
jgi:CYTH domain